MTKTIASYMESKRELLASIAELTTFFNEGESKKFDAHVLNYEFVEARKMILGAMFGFTSQVSRVEGQYALDAVNMLEQLNLQMV